MRFSKYLIWGLGLRFAIGRIRYSLEPSALLGVDWRSGVGQSAGDGRWLNALSRDKAMAAAIRLQQDVCLMTTNLNILDQYALSLQGTASKMLEKSLGSSDFPSADVAAGALVLSLGETKMRIPLKTDRLSCKTAADPKNGAPRQ